MRVAIIIKKKTESCFYLSFPELMFFKEKSLKFTGGKIHDSDPCHVDHGPDHDHRDRVPKTLCPEPRPFLPFHSSLGRLGFCKFL